MSKKHYLPVGGRKIPVLFKEQADMQAEPGDYMFGGFHGPSRSIWLTEGMDGFEKTSTLMHELVEAINQLYDLKLKHAQISTLGECLGQVVYNKDVRTIKERE